MALLVTSGFFLFAMGIGMLGEAVLPVRES
jgi:hypothetical protein